MTFFRFNPETNTGYSYDSTDLENSAEGAVTIIGAYLKIVIFAIVVIALIIAPFLIMLHLDSFVDTVIKNNILFFSLFGVLLIVVKLFTKKLSKNFFIRLFFAFYIIIAVLYISLYILHLDSFVYSIARALMESPISKDGDTAEMIRPFFKDVNMSERTEGWLYPTIITIKQKFSDFVYWAFKEVGEIDKSSFKTPLSQINIIKALKSIGLLIVIGGFAVVSAVIGWLLLFVLVIFLLALPYILAFLVLALVNNGIFSLKRKYHEKLKF